MRKLPILFAFSITFLTMNSCQKNAVTGRQQLLLVDEGDLQKLSLQQYRDFLSPGTRWCPRAPARTRNG